MAIYLDEVHLGSDNAIIGFPHLLLCMGLIYVTKTKLYGVHLTTRDDTTRAVGAFADWLETQHPTTGLAIYGSANLDVRYKGNNQKSNWIAEMEEIGDLLTFSGPARGFDTSIISPKDGTYVEYHNDQNGTGNCRIFYKRHEKMQYGAYAHNPAVAKITNSGSIRTDKYLDSPSGANVTATWSNKGNLHEVDYATRLMTTSV